MIFVGLLVISVHSLSGQALGPQPNSYHTIALHADGNVFTWGYDVYGQLGDGSTDDKTTPVRVLKGAYNGTSYLGDNPANKIISVASNRRQSMALAADGGVYTWGDNSYGQLGDGSTTQRNTPVRVLKGEYNGTTYLGDNPANKITAVAMGYAHSIALAEDGSVYTWGKNNCGQLGDGSTTQRNTPVRVLKGEYAGTTYLGDNPSNKIIAVAAGYDYSIALAEDGSVYTWGKNNYGQLGDGTTNDKTTPVRVLKGEYAGTTYLGDNPSNKIIAVALGYYHSIALAADGSVYSWGYNFYGQLGDGSTTQRNTPVRVLKGAYDGTAYLGDNPSNKIIAVAAGSDYSIALTEDGSVYTWGYNSNGQLGDGSTTQRNTPVRVLKGEYAGTTYLGDNPSNKIIAVALGYAHSIALAEDGSVYTWGYNYSGQLGDGSTTQRNTPVRVKGVGGVGDLSLPVVLSSLTGQYKGGKVVLTWTTESETENLGFILERKILGANQGLPSEWLQIASYVTDKALAGHGSTSERHEYQYIDKAVQPDETYLYRLADVDYSGRVTWHKAVEVKVEAQATQLPLVFGLKPAYPNPFNPSVTIKYGLTEDGQVSLKVYNLHGQLVETLVNTRQSAGNYTLTWQPVNLSSGVYVVHLHSGGRTVQRKIMFVK